MWGRPKLLVTKEFVVTRVNFMYGKEKEKFNNIKCQKELTLILDVFLYI